MLKLRQTIAARITLFFLLLSSGVRLFASRLMVGGPPQRSSDSQSPLDGVRFTSESVPETAQNIPVVTNHPGLPAANRPVSHDHAAVQNKPFCVAVECDDCSGCGGCGGCGGGSGGSGFVGSSGGGCAGVGNPPPGSGFNPPGTGSGFGPGNPPVFGPPPTTQTTFFIPDSTPCSEQPFPPSPPVG